VTGEEYEDYLARVEDVWSLPASREDMLEQISDGLRSIDELWPTYLKVQDRNRAAVTRVSIDEIVEGLEDTDMLDADDVRDLGVLTYRTLATMNFVVANGGPQTPEKKGFLARFFGRV
jgi:hypothetical protein